MLMSEFQKRQIRDTELGRFDRWFVDTALGPAYRDRDGRARGVKAEEVARWRADLENHVEAMIARIPVQAAWALGGLIVVTMGGRWLLRLFEVPASYHAAVIGLAIFLVEVGTVGIEVRHYVAGWRARRDAIEAAVAGRAPLPIDPRRLGSGRNWFQIAMIALVAAMILVGYAAHADEELLTGPAAYLLVAGVPAAWALHFASKWHDRREKGRLRR